MKVLKSYRNSVITSMFIVMTIMARAIKEKFNIKDVHVIPGDSDSNQTVKREIGRQAGQLLESILYEDAIVSVTGGSTMAYVSESIHLLPFNVFCSSSRWTR